MNLHVEVEELSIDLRHEEALDLTVTTWAFHLHLPHPVGHLLNHYWLVLKCHLFDRLLNLLLENHAYLRWNFHCHDGFAIVVAAVVAAVADCKLLREDLKVVPRRRWNHRCLAVEVPVEEAATRTAFLEVTFVVAVVVAAAVAIVEAIAELRSDVVDYRQHCQVNFEFVIATCLCLARQANLAVAVVKRQELGWHHEVLLKDREGHLRGLGTEEIHCREVIEAKVLCFGLVVVVVAVVEGRVTLDWLLGFVVGSKVNSTNWLLPLDYPAVGTEDGSEDQLTEDYHRHDDRPTSHRDHPIVAGEGWQLPMDRRSYFETTTG